LSLKAKAKAKDFTFKAKAKAKDLRFKAKAKAKDLTSEHIQGPSRTALDYGVPDNIKLRKSNSMVTQVHAINTLFTDLWSTVELFMR